MNDLTEKRTQLQVNTAGEGAPLLMIHGIISDASFFDGAASFLKDSYTVITYDRRGYGKDQNTWTDYTVRAQADDAAEILKAYANEPAWVFGNSAGGLIAVELALRYPELVKGLMLLEPSLTLDETSRGMILDWNRELNGYVKEKKIKKALPAFARVIGQEGGSGKETTLAEMKQTYKNLSCFMHGELNEVQHYEPGMEKLQSIACPVTVFVSTEGRHSLFGTSSVSGAELLGWPVKEIPGYHNAVKDDAETAAKLIREIIQADTME